MKIADVRVVLLAGGKGSRMKADNPKQFLLLNNKPIARYSFELFLELPEVTEIVVVCDPAYQHYFTSKRRFPKVVFALPGERRQDSVDNGFRMFKQIEPDSLICVHDSARPLITPLLVRRILSGAGRYGAATAAMPVKFTVKQSNAEGIVERTLDRDSIWEIQTPQIIRYSILKEGLEKAKKENITVTDDVSFAELLGYPVKLVEGSYDNLKITTPDDLHTAEALCRTKGT